MNVRKDDAGKTYLQKVGMLKGESNVDVNMSNILWPGNQTEVPTGVFVSNHLRVRRYFVFIIKLIKIFVVSD